ncbi:MAG TPA: hypothetical protein VF043_07740 [Ktedonobacteraceae bacterium]
MTQIVEERTCPVCRKPVVEARKASSLEYAGMSIVFHDACLTSLDEVIAERDRPTPQPVHKAVESEADMQIKEKQAAKEVVLWIAENIRQGKVND